MNVLIIGYFGRNNLGDDLMLKNLIDEIKHDKHKHNISVVFHDIDTMKDELKGINRISSSNKKEYVKAIFNSDVLVWGGGTCFYDAGSKAENRGISDLIKIGILCRIFGTKMVFVGVGIGKLTPKIASKIKAIFKMSHSLYFRDQRSLVESQELTSGNVYRSGDLALLLDVNQYQSKEKKYITYSGVYNYNIDVDKLAEILDYIAKLTNSEVAFLPCHRSPHDDNFHHLSIGEKLSVKYKIFDVNTVDEYLSVLSKSKFHVGIRLHSIVLADLLSIPNIGIEYSPKIRKYIDSTNVLSEIRSNENVSDITEDKIDHVLSDYTRPSEYINNENFYTREAIKRILR